MALQFLIAFAAAFFATSLFTFPFQESGIMLRLSTAFLAWLVFMLLPLFIPLDFVVVYWPIAYFVALGCFLGTGAKWWTGKWWRNPLALIGRFELKFAARITFRAQRSISSLVVRLGILSILLGVAVMEVAVSIVFGFEKAIQEKVIGFGSHVHIGNLLEEHESEIEPIPMANDFIPALREMSQIRNISPYILRPAMLRSALTQEGIVLKGIDPSYDWTFFQNALKEGTVPDVAKGKRFSQDLMISVKLAEVLDLKLGDRTFAYFFDADEGLARVRQFNVVGIYETGLAEFDISNVFCDLRALREIWRWDDFDVMGYEIWLNDIDNLEQIPIVAEEINDVLREHDAFKYEARSVTTEFPDLFEWVALQHQNVYFILLLMVIIAVINMVSVILILILERTRTIGLLKALGMRNSRIQELFVSNAMFLIIIGLVLGNVAGLGLIWLQDSFGFLVVDQENYFVREVPVMWKWDWFFAVNFGILGICTFFMYLPAWMVTTISPVRALRFD